MWSEEEISKLKNKYPYTPTGVLSKEIGRSENSIKTKAHRLGVSKVDNYEIGYSIQRTDEINLESVDDEKAKYVAGVVAGEGSFSISSDGNGGKTPSFDVAMNIRDKELLRLVKDILGCGKIRERSRGNDMCQYRVSDYGNIINRVIPFFEKYNMPKAYKEKQFKDWKAWIMKRVPEEFAS